MEANNEPSTKRMSFPWLCREKLAPNSILCIGSGDEYATLGIVPSCLRSSHEELDVLTTTTAGRKLRFSQPD